MLYWHYYLLGIILLPGLLAAIYAQTKVTTTYNKFSKINARCGITSEELIRRLITAANMQDIQIKQISGSLTDHYDSKQKILALSNSTYGSNSIASLGIACHEFGHALQDKSNYAPLRIRQILIPITNFMSSLLWPLVILGLIFNFGVTNGGLLGSVFLWSGVAIFGSAVLVNLITLPVEFNASKRAIKLLKETETLQEDELQGAKQVLNAAALTYLAALLVSMLNLLRFLILILSSRSRD